MDNEKKCPKCGGLAFKDGMIGNGQSGNVREIGKFMQTGSQVIVTFCLKCGEIVSMRVENPEKFK